MARKLADASMRNRKQRGKKKKSLYDTRHSVFFFFTAVQTQVSSGMRKEALQHDRTAFKLSTSSNLVHKLHKYNLITLKNQRVAVLC